MAKHTISVDLDSVVKHTHFNWKVSYCSISIM